MSSVPSNLSRPSGPSVVQPIRWSSIRDAVTPRTRRLVIDEDHFTPHASGATESDISVWWSTWQQFSGHAKFIARLTALQRCRRHPRVQSWWPDDSVAVFDGFLTAAEEWVQGRVPVASLVEAGQQLFSAIELQYQDQMNYHTTGPGRLLVWAMVPELFPPPPVEAGPEIADWWHHVLCRLAAREGGSLELDSIDAVDLANAMLDDNPNVRDFAFEALGWTPSTDAILPLLAAAVNENPTRAGAAVDRLDSIRKALGRPTDPRIRDALQSAIGSPKISSRGRAIIARMLGEDTALPILLEYIRGDDPTQRTLSTNAVSLAFRTDSALGVLIESLQHEDWPVRRAAIRALAGMMDHARPAMPRLHELAANDPSENVRISAKRAIRWIEAHEGDDMV